MINIIFTDYGREIIDTAEDILEAKQLVAEYRSAFKSSNVFYSFK